MYQKLQTGRATAMTQLLSDNEDTVNLNDEIDAAVAGVGTTGTKLVVPSRDFVALGVRQGDLVVNISSTPNCSRVIDVEGDSVTVANNISMASGTVYRILQGSTEPATLYVGTVGAASTLKVRTAGGDDVVLDNLVQGTTIPLQVVRVYNTGTNGVLNIVALF